MIWSMIPNLLILYHYLLKQIGSRVLQKFIDTGLVFVGQLKNRSKQGR
ncbi:unnamed protein product [Paramecium octaurelia]|uniref:Uncharacterized protein n=1 Tax=Paramecium octaurelia TaxID=43137 RepID=A0A8S1YFZ5_PAROT|nr:unnamed protein product [Paramecium octaurelia]